MTPTPYQHPGDSELIGTIIVLAIGIPAVIASIWFFIAIGTLLVEIITGKEIIRTGTESCRTRPVGSQGEVAGTPGSTAARGTPPASGAVAGTGLGRPGVGWLERRHAPRPAPGRTLEP